MNKLSLIYIISMFLFLSLCYIITRYYINNVSEGFKSGPKFKNESDDEEDEDNPLKYFGFKHKKSENFNGDSSKFQNALDEASRIDTKSISLGNMKSILYKYNSLISKKLKKAEKKTKIKTLTSQLGVFYDEFRNLFDIDLIL